MDFNQPKGIYQQIADQLCNRILQGEWPEGGRIPSIRELAVEIGVNPNTVTKTYQSLTEQDVIETQRGRGYFVTDGARKKILSSMKREFIREDLPQLIRTMKLLDFSVDELVELYRNSTGGEKDEN
jgi:DNA-binding transcriptional regulator YhcF (GntR family)